MSVRLAAAVAAMAFCVSGAQAQDLNGPVNLPPSGFDGQQFVDNAGCAFARAGVSGTTVWVPRVDQTRNQICGLAPTFGATAVAAAAAPEAPRSPVLTPETAPGAPIPTVASTTPAPAPAPSSAPVARDPGRLTIAEACEGRTGIQPNLIDSRTGSPVDCGGVTPAAAPAPAADEPARLTLAEACARQEATGTRLIDSATGQPIACAPAADVPRNISWAAACAEQLATGVRLLNANTGEPIECPPPTVIASAPVTAPLPAPQAEPAYTTTVAATVAARHRIDPLSAATLPGTRALGPTGAIRPGDVLSAETISGVVTQIYYGPPAGYEPVWSDGRLNPNRGLPEIQAQVPVAANPPAGNLAPAAERMSTMTAPAPHAVGDGAYVQVGTYGNPANAANAQATLQSLGLPVAVSTISRDGRNLQIVAAGPLSAADINAALAAARAAGYTDAFIR